MSTKTVFLRTVRDGEPRAATSTFTQFLSFDEDAFSFYCYFRSTKTVRLIRDKKPRAATSTFTQLLSSDRFRSVRKQAICRTLVFCGEHPERTQHNDVTHTLAESRLTLHTESDLKDV